MLHPTKNSGEAQKADIGGRVDGPLLPLIPIIILRCPLLAYREAGRDLPRVRKKPISANFS